LKFKRLIFIKSHTKILVYLYIFQFLKECIQGGDKSYDFANIINNILGSTKIVRKQRQSSCKYIPRATVYAQQQRGVWGWGWNGERGLGKNEQLDRDSIGL